MSIANIKQGVQARGMKMQEIEVDKVGAWVILVGMSGSGKSTLGSALAKKTGAPFIDVDKWACQQTQISINEMFNRLGEAAWREAEFFALNEALQVRGAVVSVGAGAVGHPASMQAMLSAKKTGSICMWMDESDAVIAKRLSGDKSRPLFAQEVDGIATIEAQRLARQDGYTRLATVRLNGAGKSLRETLDATEKILAAHAL